MSGVGGDCELAEPSELGRLKGSGDMRRDRQAICHGEIRGQSPGWIMDMNNNYEICETDRSAVAFGLSFWGLDVINRQLIYL